MSDLSRFEKVTELNDAEYRILESIRFRDDDQSVKAGAVLAFSGLIIATSIVQLSTSADSVVHVSKDDVDLLLLNITGLLLLFLSAIVTIFALISSGQYSIDKSKALIEFDEYVVRKSKKVKIAAALTSLGALCVLLALMTQLFQKIF